MTATKTITSRIIDCHRMQNTKSGNPRYQITTAQGTYKTFRDGAVNYGITNSDFRDCEVILTLTNNEITGISTLDGKITAGAPA